MVVDLVERFRALSHLSQGGRVFRLHDTGVLLGHGQPKPEHPVSITLSGLVHGNEVIGLPVLLEIFERWNKGEIAMGPEGHSIALSLGNVPAALQGVRFIERDLNRSFALGEQGGLSTGAKEETLAAAIEPFLKRSAYVLDLHQTIEESESPFFIFSDAPENHEFADALDATLPRVVYPEGQTSLDGMTLSEFARKHGARAITVELGRHGFDPLQREKGVELCLRAIEVATGKVSSRFDRMLMPEVWKFDWVYRPKKPGAATLVPGLKNMARVTRGQLLGKEDDRPILARTDGRILFPKYGKNAIQSSELFVLLVEKK